MARKPHPSDDFDRAVLERAVEFTATIFYNRRHFTLRFPTLGEAARGAAKLEADHILVLRSTRRALVYAIDANGRQALVQRSHWNPLAA